MKACILATILLPTVLPSAAGESTVEEFEARAVNQEESAEKLTKLPAWPADEKTGVAKDEIIILVKADGGIVVEGRRFNLEGLRILLKQRADLPGKPNVKIRGDAKVSYQRIAEVIEACR